MTGTTPERERPVPRPAPPSGSRRPVRRLAVRDDEDLSARLALRDADEVALFLEDWVEQDDDPSRLLSRRDAAEWLWDAIDIVWRENPRRENPLRRLRPASMRWVALSTLHRAHGFLHHATFTRVSALAARADESSRDHQLGEEVLQHLVTAFRAEDVAARTTHRGEWLQVLDACAYRAFRSRRPGSAVEAVELSDEAWGYRGDLPATLRGARVTARLAVNGALPFGYADDARFAAGVDDHLHRLDLGRMFLEGFPTSRTEDALQLLRIALATHTLWTVRASRGLVGHLTALRHGLLALQRGFATLRARLSLPEITDLDLTDPRLRDSRGDISQLLVRSLIALGADAAGAGSPAVADAARRPLEAVTLPTVLLEWRRLLDLAAFEPSQSGKAAAFGRIVALTSDLPDAARPYSAGLFIRSRDLARQLAHSYWDEHLFLAQGFAHTMMDRWRPPRAQDPPERTDPLSVDAEWAEEQGTADLDEARLLPEAPDADEISPSDVAEDARGAASAEHESPTAARSLEIGIARAREKLEGERPLGLVMSLREVHTAVVDGPMTETDLDACIDLLDAVDSWARRLDIDLPSSARASRPNWTDTLEELADRMIRLAVMFAPTLVPVLHRQSARTPALSLPERIAHAEQCAGSAAAAGRPSFELDGRILTMRLALELADEQRVQRALTDLIATLTSDASALSNAGELVDLAGRTSRQIDAFVAQLLGDGRATESLAILNATSVWLRTALATHPDLLAQLRLAERAASLVSGARRKAARAELYASIEAGLLRNAEATSATAHTRSVPATRPDGDVLVRFHVFKDHAWAVADAGHGPAAVALTCSVTALEELADQVWFELRPSRMNRPTPSLAKMHDSVVAPVLGMIGTPSSLTFAPTGAISLLPLHAAFDGAQHLIERMPVAYDSPAITYVHSAPAAGALVGGWDVNAQAQQEALRVAQQLRTGWSDVMVPRTARDGREALLAPAEPVKILHLAGHGTFSPMPESLGSYVQLSRHTTVSAAEWLLHGRRATFVFFNVCNVGRTQRVAGDVSGFPLALALRGAQSVIAANSYIPPDEARRFAIGFYEALAEDRSTAKAYRAVVVDRIASGAHAAAWAPYAHFGTTVDLHGSPVESISADRSLSRTT